jgi:Ca2+-binding EF-hand superfamily protein
MRLKIHLDNLVRTLLCTALILGVLLCSGCLPGAGIFQQLDQDSSGKLDGEEIAEGLMAMADTTPEDEVLTEQELEIGFTDINLLRQWDFDHDGDVDSLDFTFVFAEEGSDPQSRFDLWDNDQNGQLDNAELAAALFPKFDLNRDQVLDLGEVERLVVFYGLIEAHDDDDDHELSYQEFVEAAATVE